MIFTDDTPMPAGTHCGKKLGDVPEKYLFWLWVEQVLKTDYPEMHDYLEERFG